MRRLRGSSQAGAEHGVVAATPAMASESAVARPQAARREETSAVATMGGPTPRVHRWRTQPVAAVVHRVVRHRSPARRPTTMRSVPKAEGWSQRRGGLRRHPRPATSRRAAGTEGLPPRAGSRTSGTAAFRAEVRHDTSGSASGLRRAGCASCQSPTGLIARARIPGGGCSRSPPRDHRTVRGNRDRQPWTPHRTTRCHRRVADPRPNP